MPVSISLATWRSTFSPTASVQFGLAPGGTYAWEVWDPIRADAGDGPIATGTATSSTLTIPTPSGGWKLGKYIVTLPGEGVSTEFTIIDKTDPRFPVPPNNNFPYSGSQTLWAAADPRVRGQFSLGMYRLSIEADADGIEPWSSFSSGGIPGLLQIKADLDEWQTAYADTVHPRENVAAVATRGWGADRITAAKAAQDPNLPAPGVFYPQDPSDGAHVFVTIAAGTSSGRKVTIDRDGGSVTVYDNLADGDAIETATAANAHAFYLGRAENRILPDTMARRAIGDVCWTNMRDAIADLYDAGVTHLEGPWNEGQDVRPEQAAQEYLQMRAAAKSIRPAIQVGGPCIVGLHYGVLGQSGTTNWLSKVLAYAVAREGLDAFEFRTVHIYNSGEVLDLPMLLLLLDRHDAVWTAAGYTVLPPLWQTEQPTTSQWYGVARYRSAVVDGLQQELAVEHHGGSPERFFHWPDPDNFWRGPNVNQDGTLHPIVSATRQLTCARWDRDTVTALDFGANGKRRWVGTRWSNDDGACLGILDVTGGAALGVRLTVTGTGTATISHRNGTHNATVTSGAGQLLVSDYAGHVTRLTVTAGQTVVFPQPMAYVEEPDGVTISVVPVDLGTDHAEGHVPTSPSGSASGLVPPSRITEGADVVRGPQLVGASRQQVVDFASGVWNPWKSAISTFPQTVAEVDLGEVVVGLTAVEVGGQPLWQEGSVALLAFKVDLSSNGTTWTTVAEEVLDPEDWYALREMSGAKHAYGVGADNATTFRQRAIVWHRDPSNWLLPFEATNARYARLIVTNASAAGALDPTLWDLSWGNVGPDGDQRPIVRNFSLFSGDTSALALPTVEEEPPPAGPVVGSGRYVVKAGAL